MRSSGIGKWEDEMMAQSLRLLPAKQKRCPGDRRLRKVSDSKANTDPYVCQCCCRSVGKRP